MKDNKIDILFKKKLHDLEKPPRPIAWDKINSQINKDKVSILWWHKAAIIVLLCLSGFLVFYKKVDLENEQSKTLSDARNENTLDQVQKNTRENDSSGAGKYPNAPSIAKHDANTIKKENSISSKPKVNKLVAKKPKDIIVKTDTAIHAPDQYKYESEKNNNYQSNQSSIADASLFKGEADKLTQNTPPVTIEFKSRKRTIEKPLLVDNNTESNSEDHSSFTLKKLMTKVKDIKESEISLADLRQAKDNLFAFDTYKETIKSTDK